MSARDWHASWHRFETRPLLPVTHTLGSGDACEASPRPTVNLSFMSDSAELCRLLTASPWRSRPREKKESPGFQLPERVDWFASWEQWKPLTVRVRLVSVYKSLCSLPSWQVELWQTAFKIFKECTIFHLFLRFSTLEMRTSLFKVKHFCIKSLKSKVFDIKMGLKLTKQAVNDISSAGPSSYHKFKVLFSGKEEREGKPQRLNPPGWYLIKSLGVGGARDRFS